MAKILNDEAGVLFLAWPDNVYTAAPRIARAAAVAATASIRVEAIVVTE